MAQVTVMNVEDSLRDLALTKRMRVNQFFQDYDNLRSGYVSRSQFFRCLGQALGVKLSPEQEASLVKKYNICRSDRFNYRKFCDQINLPFKSSDVKHHPKHQEVHPLNLLGTSRTVTTLDPEQETAIDKLIQNLRSHYNYHQLSIRTAYKDFDVHNVGTVTETQFYRNFPAPETVSEKDLHLLVLKYRDPQLPGFINYLNFERDLQSRALHPTQEIRQTTINPFVFDISKDLTLNEILDRIKVAVYKYGIRTTGFFQDYDHLRSGVITENQFASALLLCVGKQAQLTRGEVQKIIEFYRTPDGRIEYKEFIDMMENVFNKPNLERYPQDNVERPPQGRLYRGLTSLSDAEEKHIKDIIERLANVVQKRQVMLFQYFKDFDRSTAYTRLMTPSQFYRMLEFLGISVPEHEHALLCRKFADPISGDVDYPAFVQCIDKQYVGHTTENVEMQDPYRGREVTEAKPPLPEPLVTFEELIARIRHIVMINRLRVRLFFEDFDHLRSSSMTKSRFRRSLAQLGLSKIGFHDLTPGQFQMLTDHYQDPVRKDNVIWTNFVDDIECVFTIPHLEVAPTLRVPEQEIYLVPRPGTADWDQADEVHITMVADVLQRLSDKLAQRRVLCKPVFQDFDRHNRGHVTIPQFRQALNMLQLNVTEREVKAIEAKYVNDDGFNYITFLADVDPQKPDKLMYQQRMEAVRHTNVRKALPEFQPACNLEEVLLKLKSIVFRKRIRPLDFMKDFDKLNSGRMPKMSFRRGLDASGYGLQESEIAILEDHYQSTKGQDFVEYLPFCDDLESVFTTKHLEKMPQLDCCQFKPPTEWMMNELDKESEDLLQTCLLRIAQKVKQHNMQLFPLFEDYDIVHQGYVSKTQFIRVLTELELISLVGARDFDVLWKKFDVRFGGRNDINYIAFCDSINTLANINTRTP